MSNLTNTFTQLEENPLLSEAVEVVVGAPVQRESELENLENIINYLVDTDTEDEEDANEAELMAIAEEELMAAAAEEARFDSWLKEAMSADPESAKLEAAAAVFDSYLSDM